MNYNDLYLAFKNTFSEDSELFLEWETKNSLDPDDPEMMHVYFGLIVTPYVVSLAKTKQLEKLKKAFQFFEEMAKDTDNEVQGVLQFSVLENLISEKKSVLSLLEKCFGPRTRDLMERVCIYMVPRQ